MIKSLHIENYVLIDSLELNFESGLNIITGETGAGKSILLGAIDLLLGAKADSGAIKSGATSCVIEGVFDISGYDLSSLFEDNNIDYEPLMTIRRVISPSKSRIFINDIPSTLATVRGIGDSLIDIHSQNQTRLLDSEAFQMAILDSVASSGDLLVEYTGLYDAIVASEARLKQLKSNYAQGVREEEFLRFQYNELHSAKLVSGEQQELEEQQNILSNTSAIKETLFSACDILGQSDDSVITNIKGILSGLDKISSLSGELSDISERVRSTLYEIKDIDRELSHMCDRVSDDPSRLEQINSRLDLIYSLEQKYHLYSIEELLSLQEELASKLSLLENSSEEIEQEQKRLSELIQKAKSIASKLTSRRRAVTDDIERVVVDSLSSLGMESSSLVIEVEPLAELSRSGADKVRFLFSANRGAKLHDIGKSSGGEMSRIMLTLKSLVARHVKLPTIIFDEIDSGVSGRIADCMGGIITDLSSVMQIINITHLPQVAAKGSHHFYVYKEHGDTTVTRIKKLTDSERVEHIASMLSGSEVTQAALDQARELLSRS